MAICPCEFMFLYDGAKSQEAIESIFTLTSTRKQETFLSLDFFTATFVDLLPKFIITQCADDCKREAKGKEIFPLATI